MFTITARLGVRSTRRDQSVKLTSRLHLVPMAKMCDVSPCYPYAFMVSSLRHSRIFSMRISNSICYDKVPHDVLLVLTLGILVEGLIAF